MREWHISANDPRSLILSADARLCTPDYANDQIWELCLRGGEPSVLALQTTFGLRARSFRLFGRFIEGDVSRQDPDEFIEPPVVRNFFPNFISVTFTPLPDLEVSADYWVPESCSVAGRFQVSNRGPVERHLNLEIAAILNPIEAGQRMAPVEIQAVQVLSGSSAGIEPVMFLASGAAPATGPYPALTLTLDLMPGITLPVIWSLAALESATESFELARSTASRNWDAERARIEMLNASNVEILTGDMDWDIAFALSQKVAFSLFLGPTEHLPYASIVSARLPDQGYSIRGGGSDYGYLWNGQSAFETYFLDSLILPSATRLCQGLLLNFLYTQAEDGFVDWKPGMGGQRGGRMTTPLLANLSWDIFLADSDLAFLESVFPALTKYFMAWFLDRCDRDGDQVPEWDHTMQAGFDDHPLFSRWHTWAKGVDITIAESPVLCSFLFSECQALIRIARELGQTDLISDLEQIADRLKAATRASWDPSIPTYHYWDRDAHTTPSAQLIAEQRGTGEIRIDALFNQPGHLLFHIRTSAETTRRPVIFIHGVGASGTNRIERLSLDRFFWFFGVGTATSERAYESVETIEIEGLDPTDLVKIELAGLDCQDHTLFLPLWAGISSQDEADVLVSRSITNPEQYWRRYGIPACPSGSSAAEAEPCFNVQMGWNSLIGQGMVDYGFREQAAELVTRLMNAVVKSLKSNGSFHRYYQADSGQGSGERDALLGLAPLGLFLKTLGVRLMSSQRVFLSGTNPFPWPVTVKYRGLTVLRQKEKTQVIFPDGQTVEVLDPTPQLVSLQTNLTG